MKIALLDPTPRICGPSVSFQHTKVGLRELGAEVESIAITKSGKPKKFWGSIDTKGGVYWSHNKPDKVFKAGQPITGYDLIVLHEPKCPPQDREALKTDTIPLYIQTLDVTMIPWMTTLHGPQYSEKQAPFLERCLEAGHFTGQMITPSLSFASRGLLNPMFDRVVSKLPYKAKLDDYHAPPSSRTIIGSTGRFVYNKGSHLLFFMDEQLPGGYDVEVWGACSMAMSACQTFQTLEALHNGLGYASDQWDDAKARLLYPVPWTVVTPHREMKYMGAYEDGVEICKNFSVWMGITASDFSNSLVEYTALEAMDAGCIPVVGSGCYDPAYTMVPVDGFEINPSIKKCSTDPRLERLGEAIEYALSLDSYQHNRKILLEVNHHTNWARLILEVAKNV